MSERGRMSRARCAQAAKTQRKRGLIVAIRESDRMGVNDEVENSRLLFFWVVFYVNGLWLDKDAELPIQLRFSDY